MSNSTQNTSFEPGSLIRYADGYFEVLANHGTSGKVREFPSGDTIEPFYWRFDGESCVQVPQGATQDLRKRHAVQNKAH